MSKKKRKGVVFSTDPDFEYEHETVSEPDTLPPKEQTLKLLIDRKGRKGKEVTLVQGFVGKKEDLKQLGKQLKKQCSAGGSAKNNEILIQGNFRDKIFKILTGKGYRVKKVGG